MAVVRGFRGVRYRLERPEEAALVTAPPYDVISPEQQEELHRRDPRNVIRLELPRDRPADGEAASRYRRAAALYREWVETGVLARDPQPCLYLYGQRYEAEGRTQERLGLLAALRVEPYEAGVVLPHEQTFPKHKEDRYRLLTAAQAQFSPIFGLYSAPEAGVRAELDRFTGSPPAAVSTDADGVEHRLWPIADSGFAAWAAGVFEGRQVFIADGHHRYETALRYAAERRAGAPAGSEPYDYVMTFLVEMEDPGLVLLPTHRLVRTALPAEEELRARLEPFFCVEGVPSSAAEDLEHHQIGAVLPGGRALRLTLREGAIMDRVDTEHSPAWRDLDVAVLHRLVLEEALGIRGREEIVYTRDPAEARQRAASGEFGAAFLLPRPRVEELKAVAGAGDRMPEKSTYFWPKAISGLVIYSL
jgi:uncharacterized protein (DUF1015 family)